MVSVSHVDRRTAVELTDAFEGSGPEAQTRAPLFLSPRPWSVKRAASTHSLNEDAVRLPCDQDPVAPLGLRSVERRIRRLKERRASLPMLGKRRNAGGNCERPDALTPVQH